MKFLLIPILVSCLILSSCSSLSQHGIFYNRNIASIEDDLQSYLGIDRLQYYITEYTYAMDGKIPDNAMIAIKSITPEKIFAEGIDSNRLEDAKNYDKLIYEYLQKYHGEIEVNQTELKWGYNFLKTKSIMKKTKLFSKYTFIHIKNEIYPFSI